MPNELSNEQNNNMNMKSNLSEVEQILDHYSDVDYDLMREYANQLNGEYLDESYNP